MTPRILVPSEASPVDRPAPIRVSHLPDGVRVMLRLDCRDTAGTPFSSWAEFQAAEAGLVDTSRQEPLQGAYEGSDPFGLWWSMRSRPDVSFVRDLDPIRYRVSAEIEGECVARKHLTRLLVAPGTRIDPISRDGLVATLFVPSSDRPRPGLIVMGGSEGGLGPAAEQAALLASHGFAALALAYFGAAGLPPHLSCIPVEYAEGAVQWMLERPDVADDGIGLVGTSRGGELALLLASRLPAVRATVAFASSCVLWPGSTSQSPLRAAWTVGGRDLPFAVPKPFPRAGGLGPLSCKPWFLAGLCRNDGQRDPMVRLDQIRGAVLLVSGGDDRMWPSRGLANRAMRHLRKASAGNRESRFCHLTYPAAGHGVGRFPGLPAASTVIRRHTLDIDLGGSRAANARSAQHSWPLVLQFLRRHLDETDLGRDR